MVFHGKTFNKLKTLGSPYLISTAYIIAALIGAVYVDPLLSLALGAFAIGCTVWNLDLAIRVFLAVTLLVPSTFSWRFGLFDIGPARIMLIFFIFTWIYYWKKGKVQISRTPYDLVVLLILFAMLMSFSVNSITMNDSQFNQAIKAIFVTVVEWFVLFYFVSGMFNSFERIKKITAFITVLIGIVAVVAITESIFGIRPYDWIATHLPALSLTPEKLLQTGTEDLLRGGVIRVVSTTTSPHEVGLLMAMGAPIAIYMLSIAKKLNEKVAWLIILGVIATGLSVTVTRGAYLAIIAVVACVTVLSRNSYIRLNIYYFFIFGAIIVLLVPNMKSTIGGVLLFGFTGDDASSKARSEDWPQAQALLKENELLGIGTGKVLGHQLDYGNTVKRSFFWTDNYFLAWLTETGIIGLASLSFMWLTIGITLARGKKIMGILGEKIHDLRIAYFATAIAFFIMCLTFDAFAFINVAKIFWVILGLAAALSNYEIKQLRQKNHAFGI